MIGTKIILSIIIVFLLVFGLYLIFSKRTIEGIDYYSDSGIGWTHNSLSGYFILFIGIGLLIVLIMILRGKKLN